MDLSGMLGKRVVVDYRTSNGKIAYARGLVVSLEGTKVCVSGPSRFWMIDISVILVLRVVNGEKQEGEPGSYLGGEAPCG